MTAPEDSTAQVLKDEPATRVEIQGSEDQRVVVKTYRNRGLRLLQTFGRRSRARREFDNLAAVQRLGLPLTRPVRWSEQRRFGFVRSSTLVTVLAPDTQTLKAVLGRLSPEDPARRHLATAIGTMLRELHAGGVLWGTPMPRNLLVIGAPCNAELWLCDLPAAIVHPKAVPPRTARIDLFDALFSPSRQRDFTRAQRLRGLCAYAAGDRPRARQLWRTLENRTKTGHRLHKNLVMGLRTYILAPLQTRPSAAPPGDAHR